MTAIAAAFATAVHFCQSRCQHPVPLCCQLLPLLHLHCHGSAATSQLRFCCNRGCHQCSLTPHFCSVKANCSSVTAATCSHPPVQPVLLMTDVKSRQGRSLYKRLLLGLMLQCRGQGSTGVCYMTTEWAHVRSEQSFRKKWRTGFRSLTALFLLQQSQLPTAGPRKRNVPLWPGYQ